MASSEPVAAGKPEKLARRERLGQGFRRPKFLLIPGFRQYPRRLLNSDSVKEIPR